MSNIEFEQTNLSNKQCQLCNNKQSKYCCPRCNILYCSIDCYKSNSHSQCSESFYKDCCTEELASMSSDPRSKTKMLEILKKMREVENPDTLDTGDDANSEGSLDEKDSDDDESIPDIADRFENINLDDSEAVWSLLTEDEKKEFEALVKSDVTQILPVWEPWWLYHIEKKLVSPITNNETEETKNYKVSCPPLFNDIKNISDISSNKPSTCVKFNIINVLSSYIYMTRLFNGDHHELCEEAANCIILLSCNLNKGSNFENIEMALESVLVESLNNDTFACSKNDKIQMKYDLKCLIRGPEESNMIYYILCALSDVILLLNNVKKNGSETNTTKNSKKTFSNKFSKQDEKNLATIQKEKLKPILKKIEYYLAYVKQYAVEMVTELLYDVYLQ